ncbi:MAG: putative pre-16S rRNA nuclease [Candidatus Poribacteria bacterium]|nr:MAG: putative pre-16S rRNA nuclease [Candidatus Poribacteria bacterium]
MGVILALDVGEKRIGVAASDPLELLASPVTTLRRSDDRSAIAAIAKLVRDRGAERVVVGVPKTLRNEEGVIAQRVLRFVERLRRELSVPVETWDERLTTVQAERILRRPEAPGRRRGRSKKRHRYIKEHVDQVAAVLLLESYLSARGRRGD